jgi:AcrR family transcriptional regulator
VPRAKQRTIDLHEHGVSTALEVLAGEGVAGLTARNVARRANASVPAVYEVFGDKAGLIREVFFEGFRMIGDALSATAPSGDPIEDLRRLAEAFREFVTANPTLAEVMFSRPFADFDPTTADDRAGVKVRTIFVARVRAAVDTDLLVGDPTDIAQVLFALVEGLSSAESAQRIGSSKRSVDRRWDLALTALLAGLGPQAAGPAAAGRCGPPRRAPPAP